MKLLNEASEVTNVPLMKKSPDGNEYEILCIENERMEQCIADQGG